MQTKGNPSQLGWVSAVTHSLVRIPDPFLCNALGFVGFVLRLPTLEAKCLQEFQIQCCSPQVQKESFSLHHPTKLVASL